MSGNQYVLRAQATQTSRFTTMGVLLFAACGFLVDLPADFANAQSSPFGSTNSRSQSSATTQEAPAAPAPIPTNQTTFGIPIVVHQHPERIAEFQLLLSLDRGQNWSIYQKRTPGDEEFSFKAQNDGEYWFAMRTIDRNRQPRPVGPPQPELVIAVDTEKPHLQFEAIVGQSGNVFSRWDAADPTLVPESFSLQYRAAGGLLKRAGDWIDVPLKTGSTPTHGICRGEESWWPEIEAGTIEVKATIRDAANNIAVDTRKIEIPKVARQLRPETPPYHGELAQQRRATNNDRVTQWPANESDSARAPQGHADAINPHEVPYTRIADAQNHRERSPSNRAELGMQSVTATTQPADTPLSPQDNRIASRPQEQDGRDDRSRYENGSRFLSISDQPREDDSANSIGNREDDSSRNPYHLASQTEPSRSSSDLSPTPNEFTGSRRPSTSLVDDGPGYETLPPPVATPPRFMPNDLRESNQPRPLMTPQQQDPNGPALNTPSENSANPLNLGRDRYQAPIQPESTPYAPSNQQGSSMQRPSTQRPSNQRSAQDVALPPGEYALLTNRRQFRLTYEIDAVRPEAVDEVELWITRDGGNSWESWATDPDRQSPFEVHVEEEGIYGFKIVVSSKEGFAGQAPRAGDLADIWVEVDMTSPEVEIISAPLGKGPDAGKLVIQWLANDHKLTARPITLYYAESLEGPWNVIAAGLENSGTYAWRVDASTPKMIFLRIEAEDKAGNSASHDLITPVDLRRLNPTGRIKGFDNSAAQGDYSARLRRPFRFVR